MGDLVWVRIFFLKPLVIEFFLLSADIQRCKNFSKIIRHGFFTLEISPAG